MRRVARLALVRTGLGGWLEERQQLTCRFELKRVTRRPLSLHEKLTRCVVD